jgi:hypothetical protein
MDDAAMAALWQFRHAPREHISVMYGDDFQHAPFVKGRESTTKGAFTIPSGSLKALLHNHPESPGRDKFSNDDKSMAKHRGVPSYVAAGEKLLRYDPRTGATTEVLAQIPLDEIRKKLIVRGLLK